ncbi:putative NRPS-like enzyme [Hypoxylon crocopeplum]|nr:putative NRPS-like enzyme [Hypoxylon crocopeplum]
MATQHAHVSGWQNDLLPHIVDRLAHGLWPVAPASYEAGFRKVTYAHLANIVNGLAWWLVDQLGTGQKGEALTYVGPNDVRLTAFVIAAIKSGYVLFLTSPRNSLAAHRALFDVLECKILVTTDPVPPPALSIIDAVKPRVLTAPSVDELFSKSYPPYVYDKTFEEARWDPLWVIHTSGSTGLPKPLIWTQESGARHHNCAGSSPPDGVLSIDSFCRGKSVLVTVPPFHGAGLAQYLLNAIPFGNIGVVDALKQAPAEIAVLVPSVVAELAQNPELLDYCASHLEMIIYIGGDLPQTIGDRVAAKVRLRCQWGASEVGIPQQLMPPELGPMDWRYVRFHPSAGAVFDEAADGVYELPSFGIRGLDKLEKEYRTRDLFERHPTVRDAWCWRARADDIIVFLNGEKTNPVSMEQHVVASNPELSGALVIGAQKLQAALLIEPAALIERVWHSVQEANQLAPAHARVEKSLILVISEDRPLIRAGKGTIQRSSSLAQYTVEIDRLYANADLNLDLDDNFSTVPLDQSNAQTVGIFVQDAIRSVTGWQDLDDSTGFFEHGMDSLQALQLTRALRRGLHRPDLALSTVYRNPTVSQLKTAIMTQNQGSDDADMMGPLLSTYRGLIHQMAKPKTTTPSKEDVVDVILTGSTGTIGTYILRALLDRPGIGHVFCLNRGKDGGRGVQHGRFVAANLPSDGVVDRVTFIQADLAHPSLGLDEPTYETLRARAGLVIHNAWPVNFNLGLPAFRQQLAGLVNLFALSAAAAHAMRIVFISSVSAVGGRAADAGPAPEAVLEALDTPFASGYARSKFISERLCDTAARHLEVPVAVARVGQVAGPVRRPGLWNRSEWLPSLVISSMQQLGCLPNSVGPQFSEVDWMPSDLLADVIVELASQPSPVTEPGAVVFNLRNPNTTTWNALLPAVKDAVQARLGRELEVVSPSAWIARLQESMADTAKDRDYDLAAAAVSNPAIKLLDFYRDGLWAQGASSQRMAVGRALASQTLRDMQPVSDGWVCKWVNEWMAAAQE